MTGFSNALFCRGEYQQLKQKVGISFLAVILAVSCFFPSPSFAETKTEQKMKQLQQEKDSKKAEAKEVLALLDEKKSHIEKIENQIDHWDQQIAKLNQDLQKNETLLKEQEQQFKHVVKRLYLNGETEYMAKLLEADSFSEFLARYEVVRLIVKQDASILNEYKDTKKKYEADLKKLNNAKAKQAPLLDEARNAVEDLEKVYQKHKTEIAQLEKKERILEAESGYGGYGSGVLRFPTTAGMVYWNYGQNRGSHIHAGVDIPRPSGTPIYAAESGTVILTKSDPNGYGYYIKIRHDNGLVTLYAHMYRSTVTVSMGQRVRRGQKIAAVGNNGRSYGARGGYHLHFEVHKNGVPVNPKSYIH